MSHTQTDTTPAAIEALLKDVTPGPWRVGPVDDCRVEDADGNEVAMIDGDYNHPDTWRWMEANARFIAAARDLVPALAAELATARAERDEARAEGAKLAAWQCSFTDGKTGLVCDEYGSQFCAMQRRAEKAETEAAALRKEVERLRGALEWQAEQPEAHPFMVARALAVLKGAANE